MQTLTACPLAHTCIHSVLVHFSFQLNSVCESVSIIKLYNFSLEKSVVEMNKSAELSTHTKKYKQSFSFSLFCWHFFWYCGCCCCELHKTNSPYIRFVRCLLRFGLHFHFGLGSRKSSFRVKFIFSVCVQLPHHGADSAVSDLDAIYFGYFTEWLTRVHCTSTLTIRSMFECFALCCPALKTKYAQTQKEIVTENKRW